MLTIQEAGHEGEAVYYAIRSHRRLGLRTPTAFLTDCPLSKK